MVVKVDQTSFDLLGKRWSALIVQDLIGGPRRFRELLGNLGKINDKVLSQRLKELEERGIVERRVFAEVPVRVEYRLTDKGRALADVIGAMEAWDASWSDGKARANGEHGQITNGATRQEAVAEPVPAAADVAPVAGSPSEGPAAGVSSRYTAKPFWKRLGL